MQTFVVRAKVLGCPMKTCHPWFTDCRPKLTASLSLTNIFRCVTIVFFQKQGEEIPGEQIAQLLDELDTNRNGQVELDEYLQVRAARMC